MSEVRDVKIESAGEGWVSYDGYTVVSKQFSGAKVGQTWRITVEYPRQFPTGKVVNAVLVKEAS